MRLSRLRDRSGHKFWIVSAYAPMETAEDNSKDAFALMSKMPSQQVVIVGIDANAKMELEQQSDVLGKLYYPPERTSDKCDGVFDLCELHRRASSSLPRLRGIIDAIGSRGRGQTF
ncbi:hypothetical protein RB195_023607 [Necator americanus]